MDHTEVCIKPRTHALIVSLRMLRLNGMAVKNMSREDVVKIHRDIRARPDYDRNIAVQELLDFTPKAIEQSDTNPFYRKIISFMAVREMLTRAYSVFKPLAA